MLYRQPPVERNVFELPGYNIERQIGTGGMATVHLATQIAFKRKVAIKVLMPAYAQDMEFAQRFLREAETVANLSHAHIIPVYDFGQIDGTFYMVMEYLSGGDLLQWIKRGLAEEEVLQITSDIASALHLAHEKGFVHRDVKPDNVMFRDDHTAVLTDFGIARQKDANEQITVAGSILGTPKYMSPEQLQGHPVDGRTDIYSLGIMFFEMLTRAPPYEDKEFMALAMKHIKSPIPRLPIAVACYQKMFEHMVAKSPEHRFQSGAEIVKLIQGIRNGQIDISQFKDNNSAPVEDAVIAKPAVKEGVITQETQTKTGWFNNKFKFSAKAVAVDWTRLTMMLDTLSNQLLSWRMNRGKGADAVEFIVVTQAENFPKVRSKIKAWGNTDGGKFLKKNGLRMVLKDIDTNEEHISKLHW